jgi:hypothetical protein
LLWAILYICKSKMVADEDKTAADKNMISFQIDYQHCHFKFTMNIVI